MSMMMLPVIAQIGQLRRLLHNIWHFTQDTWNHTLLHETTTRYPKRIASKLLLWRMSLLVTSTTSLVVRIFSMYLCHLSPRVLPAREPEVDLGRSRRQTFTRREKREWEAERQGRREGERERERHLLLDTFGNSRLYLQLFCIYQSLSLSIARSIVYFSSPRLHLTHEIKLSSMRSTRDLLYPRE